jgi:hypothetical protein
VIPDLVSLALSNIGNGLPEKAAPPETARGGLRYYFIMLIFWARTLFMGTSLEITSPLLANEVGLPHAGRFRPQIFCVLRCGKN